VYLPDELGAWAKQAGLPLSRMLREAIEKERKRQDAVAATLGKADVYEAEVAGATDAGFRRAAAPAGRTTASVVASVRTSRACMVRAPF
jgi:post-segregation antitoxin (ccd killing protein)